MSSSSFGKCQYCGKQILWIKTKAGKNMPVDTEIISYCKPKQGVKAKERLVTPEGEIISADRTDSDKADGFGYISHFATCKKRNR